MLRPPMRAGIASPSGSKVRSASLRLVALALSCAATAAAFGQAYPAKPIKIVVGFPPGGGNDLIARLVGAKLQDVLGQPVVIENKAGANAIIASEFVAKSPPDGYTLLVGATGQMVINPVLYEKLPYDSLRDLVPITTLALFPMVLVAHPSVPVHSVAELIAYSKTNPDQLCYSAGSTAFQVATEMLKGMTGMSARHIPYKGSAQAINAVVAGDVQIAIVDSAPVVAQIRAGKLKPLAVTSATRNPLWPRLPTLSEAGVPGYEMVLWSSVFAPAGTPTEIVDKLQAEIAHVLQEPEVQERFAEMAVIPGGGSSSELAARMREEMERYRAVARAAHIKPE